ncbi:MAG: hypothetical protein AAF990_26720 [Bacteroidota bacterium]
MKNIFCSLIFVLFIFSAAYGQNTIQPRSMNFENKGLVFNKELAVDLRIHTNRGLALAVNVGQIKTYYKTRYYHFEIGELRHPKEQRQSFDYPSWGGGKTSRSFILGKINNLYAIRAGIGEKRYFSEKAKRKGLAIGVNYEGGFTLGLLKPYYLEIIRSVEPGSPRYLVSEKYNEENRNIFLDENRIYGSSGFTKGLSELGIRPGAHFKASIHFDWGAFDEFVKAIEAGIMGDIFLQKVPIMADVDGAENRPFFINLFISLQLGKRW